MGKLRGKVIKNGFSLFFNLLLKIFQAGKAAKKTKFFRYISNRLSLHYAKKHNFFADKLSRDIADWE